MARRILARLTSAGSVTFVLAAACGPMPEDPTTPNPLASPDNVLGATPGRETDAQTMNERAPEPHPEPEPSALPEPTQKADPKPPEPPSPPPAPSSAI